MIIAIEGIDGAGKNTLVSQLRKELNIPVEVLAFPRYEDSIHAQLAQEALYGRMGDLTSSAYAMATLFALDRHGAKQQLEEASTSSNLLILDRYVASNAAYSAARLGDDAVMDWVFDLEFGRLGLPKPDLQIYLATEVGIAAQRASSREAQDASREKDQYEKDGGLQAATAAAYARLAEANWAGQWIAAVDKGIIIDKVLDLVGE
ncbi:dTMP kinase [Corynebacterium ammoniagenes]|uniref:Thymidylate kinase n=2 Tax=Corynebacterium ammoniagenes TaxID=1697 RepID=A0AAV5GA77_CORAM|nr:dTMP kinase [Corynebacterium ammoniagenes]APT83223.1 thymidylate kinase [Corynebacterium ammoniagenes DSM 20306]AQS74245.1 thymidylate kinase [Corynebacterium ammoniagenes]EFG81541.1 dTMP kinase [Corynebacterium ammoniagenes DSM 20306]NMF32966.1 dTMP kinase [Corynebacterium ammoniagenes]GJN43519.1 thymidylate kinase [Corynebacterium ammoniagenes]